MGPEAIWLIENLDNLENQRSVINPVHITYHIALMLICFPLECCLCALRPNKHSLLEIWCIGIPLLICHYIVQLGCSICVISIVATVMTVFKCLQNKSMVTTSNKSKADHHFWQWKQKIICSLQKVNPDPDERGPDKRGSTIYARSSYFQGYSLNCSNFKQNTILTTLKWVKIEGSTQ